MPSISGNRSTIAGSYSHSLALHRMLVMKVGAELLAYAPKSCFQPLSCNDSLPEGVCTPDVDTTRIAEDPLNLRGGEPGCILSLDWILFSRSP